MSAPPTDVALAKPRELTRGAGTLALALGGALLAVILAVTYRGVLADLVRQWWDDENYSHGFLVPVFSAYVVWERRAELAAAPRDGTWWGLPVLVAGIAALIVGDVGAENFLTRSSLIVILGGLVLLHLGSRIARILAFPLAYLFFMVPLPAIVFYAIAFPLQGLAAENAAWALDLLGVPVLLDGNVIRLSQITLGVTEACSGIRSLISLLALAVALGLSDDPGLLGGRDPRRLRGADHRLRERGTGGRHRPDRPDLRRPVRHGLLPLLLRLGHLRLRVLRTPGGPRAADGGEPVAGTSRRRHSMKPGRLVLSAALLLGAFLVLQLRGTGEAVPVRQPLSEFPSSLDSWEGRPATTLDVEVLNILKVKDYLMRRYTDRSGKSLWLYIGYWDSQRKGAQPHSPRNCLPGGGWEPLEAKRIAIPLPDGQAPITVNRYVIQKDQYQQVVLYWYQSQGRAVAGEVAARVDMVRNALTRNRTDGALVRVSMPVYGSIADTSDALVRYVQAMYPVLGRYLPD